MSIQLTHPSGTRMRLAESLIEVARAVSSFTLDSWIKGLSEQDIHTIQQVSQKIVSNDIADEDEADCDDLTACALIALQEESGNAEPSFEMLSEAINALHLAALLVDLERKDLLKITSPLSILSDKQLSFHVTDAGLKAGIDPGKLNA